MLTLCYVMDETAKRGVVPLGDGAVSDKSDREWIAARVGESAPPPPAPPPEPSLAERFRLAFLASDLVSKVLSYSDNIYQAFYDLAEAYGATNPKAISRLASAITNRKASPFSPPDWMFGDDGDNMQSHERRALCQWSGYVHPYTCNDDPCRGKTSGAPLHPKREGGWVCLHCGLHQ